jgi:hypothetical protein
LLFNESKLAASDYSTSAVYKNNFYFVGGGVNDSDETKDYSYANALVVKTDICGKTIWRKFFNHLEFNNGIANIIIIDGFLYISGLTNENAYRSTSFIAKINEEGDLIWYKVFNYKNDYDITFFGMLSVENKIIAYGYYNYDLNQGNNFNSYVMEIDTGGNITQDKTIDLCLNESVEGIIKLYHLDSGYLCIMGVDSNYFFNNKWNNYHWGMLNCRLNDNFNIISIDTFKSEYLSSNNLIDYNENIKKFIFHLTKRISSDSTHRQIAFLDSAGHLEKIIEDPYSPIYYPKNLIAYQDGWVANWDGGLVKFSADYKKEKNIVFGRIDTGYFVSNNTSVVRNGTALLVTGGCNGCNPYDDNTDGKYERPTAIMIDSNFKDFGKAQPPIEAPKPFAAIKAFPNPALESITLQITETSAEYAIYNSMGMFVSSGSMASSADISLLNMASGMYFIQLKTPQGNYIGNVKFLKK